LYKTENRGFLSLDLFSIFHHPSRPFAWFTLFYAQPVLEKVEEPMNVVDFAKPVCNNRKLH